MAGTRVWWYAMLGAELRYGGTLCGVLSSRMVLHDMVLRRSYGVCGTELRYVATRSGGAGAV
eukprot:1329003-Rhodomonas_salina.1